jgi:hypothetical protein
MWRALLSSDRDVVRRLDTFQPMNMPWLHLEGADMPKWGRFSDELFLKRVELSMPGVSKVVESPGGHWLINVPAHFASYIAKVEAFLASTEGFVLGRPPVALTPVPAPAKL